MIDSELLLQQAEDIFFELAHENLSEQKLALLSNPQVKMFIEINEDISSLWPDLLYEEIDPTEYIEIELSMTSEGRTERLALLLLGLDLQNDKECHIHW